MIDVIIVVVLVGYAVGGYRRGLVVGTLSLAGLLGAAVLAMQLVPDVLDRYRPGMSRSLVLLAAVVMIASIGQIIGFTVGVKLHERIRLPMARTADQLLGAVAAMVAAALVLWFVAGAARAAPSPGLARAVASSRLLRVADAVIPQPVTELADQFRATIADSSFPRVFSGLDLEPIFPTDPPDPAVLKAGGVDRARGSIVKVTGEAKACRRGREGSGSVIGPKRVLTNAHVVAGVNNPSVQVGGTGTRYPATVVVFDPQRDLAVLAVPDLTAPALRQATDLGAGDSAVVAGFPLDGPFTVGAARVRRVLDASGNDIYGKPGAERSVYSLYATVQPGNSGGPLLTPDGALAGVVFARSLDNAQTGYALTLTESQPVIQQGLSARTPVPTGPCTAG